MEKICYQKDRSEIFCTAGDLFKCILMKWVWKYKFFNKSFEPLHTMAETSVQTVYDIWNFIYSEEKKKKRRKLSVNSLSVWACQNRYTKKVLRQKKNSGEMLFKPPAKLFRNVSLLTFARWTRLHHVDTAFMPCICWPVTPIVSYLPLFCMCVHSLCRIQRGRTGAKTWACSLSRCCWVTGVSLR